MERELNVPLPLAKIIKKWNNLLQEYKAIKMSEEPKRRDWPFFNMMDVYFSDQVNDPTLRLFSSTKTFGTDNLDDCDFKDSIGMSNAIAAANAITAQIKRENSMNREYNNNNREMANNNNASTLDIADMMQDTKSIGSMDDDSVSLNLTTNHISRMEHNNNNVAFANNNNYNSKNNNGGSAYADYDDVVMDSQQQPAHQQPQNHQQKPHDPVPRQKDVSREELLQQAEHHNIDQYLLSWNNFYGNMCRGFHSLQKDEKMVDVTIAAGGKIFKAHKLVLSVCSPYFQKIFLEHPSNHPILFMTDVHSNYMAGLLDFMYSGQVNVKYEDLPNFLKVAEAMQIKGLHNESTSEPDADSNNNKKDMKNNNNSSAAPQNNNNNNAKATNLNFKQPAQSPSPYMMDAYQQQQQQMLLATQQQQHFRNLMSSTPKPSPPLQRNSTSSSAQPPITSTTPAPSAIAAAAAAAAALRNLNNASPFGGNNSNGSQTSNNRESPSQTSPKYQIHSTSKSMLDNTKHQKYFSKRKLSSIDAIADTISQSVASAVATAGNGNAEGESNKRHKLLIHHNQHQEDINKNYKKLMMMAANNNNNNSVNDKEEDDLVTETSAAQSTTSTNNGPSGNERQTQSASPILDDQKMIKMEPETQLESSTNMTSSTTATGNDDEEVYYADSPTSNSTLSAAAKLRHSILESHLRQNENSAFAGKLAFNRPQTS